MSKVSGGSPSVQSKTVYRVQNWSSYNRALVARGSLAVWIDDSLWGQWYALRVGLPKKQTDSPGSSMHLVVDSTGLKVYGEGEWQVRQHGWTKRRTWRKLAETLIYRYKHLIGDTLKARTEANQQVESRLGCARLNRMLHLGKPESYRIEKSN